MAVQTRPSQLRNLTSAKRMSDTEANRRYLEALAARDGVPSVVARQGGDVLLLSGAARTESRIARLGADDSVSRGDRLTIDGAEASVLFTDDGFREIPQAKVVVAVIDSGVDTDHPALKGRLLPGYNVETKGRDVEDTLGHGTHVAGIIAGSFPSEGLEGVAQGVTILPIKIPNLSTSNTKFMPQLAESIRYAADHGAKVVNISLGIQLDGWLMKFIHGRKVKQVEEAIRYAESKGVVVVVAAGNYGTDKADTVGYPGNSPNVISVANLDDTSRPLKAHFSSSHGPEVDLAAPGTAIRSSVPNDTFANYTGTSMAAPYVAGVAALLAASNPHWTPAQIRQRLYVTADDLGKPGRDNTYGHGAIDPYEAIFGL
ncbi:Subtilisin E precursor [compost metagenome]